MHDIDAILTSIFKLDRFRSSQREVVLDLLGGRDALVVMPTGAGKSLCYQLPAVALRGLTLIVSPLISLMTDQVRQLRELRIPAMMLSSGQSREEQSAALGRLREGFRGLLYVAPERFAAPGFLSIITARKLSLLAIDEAHCISQWGHDFRPEYLRLGEVRRQLGSPRTVALTATATPQVRADIVRNLELDDPAIHVTGFDRPNLSYQSIVFEKARNKDGVLLEYLSRQSLGGIVYCSTRKLVEQLAALLDERLRGRTVLAYHAGMDAEARSLNQRQFTEHTDAIVVATNAFGMGINKANVRYVIHYNVPGSLEAYYQEAGRAGRDGLPADCILYFATADVMTQKFFIDKIGENNQLSDQAIARLRQRAGGHLQAMQNYARWERCRRRQILEYFGEERLPQNCRCDVCSAPASTLRRSVALPAARPAARPAAKPVAKPAARSSAVAQAAPISVRIPRRLPAAAVSAKGQEARVPFWEKNVGGNRPSRKTERSEGAQVSDGGAVALGKPNDGNADEGNADAGKAAAAGDTASAGRLERMRTLRLKIARERGWKAFQVMHDSTLAEMVRLRPRTIGELLNVKGIGAAKAEAFGSELLAELGRE